MSRAIDNVQHCATMEDVRFHVDALDDVLVPLLVQRGGYMTQAARIKRDASQVRDEERIETIVARVRERTLVEGGQPDVLEAIYRSMMEAYIAYEHREFARLRAPSATEGSQP
jgi:isochorismate pyruvate lyase